MKNRILIALLLVVGFAATVQRAEAQITSRTYVDLPSAVLYAGGTTYVKGDLVKDSTGDAYVSLVSGNIGNTPATSPTYWLALGSAGAVNNVTTTGANCSSITLLSGVLNIPPCAGATGPTGPAGPVTSNPAYAGYWDFGQGPAPPTQLAHSFRWLAPTSLGTSVALYVPQTLPASNGQVPSWNTDGSWAGFTTPSGSSSPSCTSYACIYSTAVTLAPSTGATAVTCYGTCTISRGNIGVTTSGTPGAALFTVTWPATGTALFCTITQGFSSAWYGIGVEGSTTTTGFTGGMGAPPASATVYMNYVCTL